MLPRVEPPPRLASSTVDHLLKGIHRGYFKGSIGANFKGSIKVDITEDAVKAPRLQVV